MERSSKHLELNLMFNQCGRYRKPESYSQLVQYFVIIRHYIYEVRLVSFLTLDCSYKCYFIRISNQADEIYLFYVHIPNKMLGNNF